MPEQKNFTVYRASAGSGKTFTLVREYLALALAGNGDEAIKDNFRHILAITFTNKATNEMKQRILDTLADLGANPSGNMADALCQELGIQPPELSRRAALLQKAILHNYSDFAVCTIDSFMNRIVRTFAIDLGLSPTFDISLDDRVVLENAVDSLIADIGDEHADLTNVIRRFSLKKMEENKSFNVRKDILTSAQKVMDEDFVAKYGKLEGVQPADFIAIAENLLKNNRDFEQAARAKAKKICDNTAALNLDDDDFNGKSRSGAYAFFRALSRGERYFPSPTVQNNIDSGNIANSKSDNTDAVLSLVPEMRQALAYITENSQLYMTRKLLLEKVFQVALLKEVRDKIRAYYEENAVVHISENNKLISETVRKEEASFVFERLGCRYRHFLIDEFQDTSIMQWNNMLPLIENGMAEGYKSLIVGDGKQAIYRFRQGDVEQFQYVLQPPDGKGDTFTKQRKMAVARNGQEKKLDTNYRSYKEIVDFNNGFFTSLEGGLASGDNGSPLMNDIYVGDDPAHPSLVQKVADGKEGGYVEVMFYNKDNDEQPSPFERIFDTISHLLSIGFNYKDIAVLTRKNDELSVICSNLLLINEERKKTGQGLDNLMFATAESLKLWNNADAKFLRSALSFLADDSNDVAKVEMAEYLNSRGDGRPLAALIDDKENFAALLAETHPAFDRDWLLSQTLYDCTCELIRIFDVPQTPYVYSLLNYVADYSIYNRNNFNDLLESLDEVWEKLSAKTSNDLNAIQMMTIHKSKGLEFPVVIYYMLPKKESGKDEMWVEIDEKQCPEASPLQISLLTKKKDAAQTVFEEQYRNEVRKCEIDDLNVLYVALTRPEQQLYILAQKPSGKPTAIRYEPFLMDYVKNPANRFSEIETGSVFGKGDPDFCVKKKDKETNITLLRPNNSKSWTKEVRIVGKVSSVMQYHDTQAQQVGNIVHEILSHIGALDEVEKAAANFMADARLDKAVEERVAELLRHIMESDEVRRFFRPDYDYKTECDIMLGKDFNRPPCFNNQDMVRPDRIVFADGETWVVDFKTGNREEKYINQVNGYKAALNDMGYTNVKGYLLYISDKGCEVEEV